MDDVLFLAAGLTILPTVIYVLLIYIVDQYEKEPFWLLIVAFIWGAVPSILLTLIAHWLIIDPLLIQLGNITHLGALVDSLSAPFVEESIKGLALLGILFFRPHDLDTPLDGIIYGSMIGMGFAMVENYFYFLSVYQESGLLAMSINVFLRAVLFGLNHALFTGLLGLAVAGGRYYHPFFRTLIIVFGWGVAVFFHSVHNLTVTTGGWWILLATIIDWVAIAAILLIIYSVLWREQQWLKLYLCEEVKAGTLSQAQYEMILSRRQRTRSLLGILLRGRLGRFLVTRRYYHNLCKLAYAKHHYAVRSFPDLVTIEHLRQKSAQLGQQLTI